MAAAPAVITRTTFATRTVGDGDAQDNILLLTAPSLRSGDNVLAIEVHQVNLTGSDMTMGIDLSAITATPLAVPPTMAITYNAVAGTVTITWNPAGGTLQASDDLVTWTDVAGASGVVIPATAAHRFYRVRQ